MSLAAKPIQEFLAELASVDPVPGGGSVAALGGALGAALAAMVLRLTVGRMGYEAVGAELESLLPRADELQADLRDLMQADVDSYARVMDAYQMPKTTEAQTSARTRAVQEALKGATEIPLLVAEKCAEVLALTRMASEKGNKNAADDARVGSLMAEAGLRAAAINVTTNLALIKDQAYVQPANARVARLLALADENKKEIAEIVQRRM